MSNFNIIRKNKYLFVIFTVICFLLYLILFLISSQEQKFTDVGKQIDDSGQDYQFTGEMIEDMDYNNYLSEDNEEMFYRLNDFKKYRDELLGNKYISISPQAVEVFNLNLPSVCADGYEDGNLDFTATDDTGNSIIAVKAISVSASFFENFGIVSTNYFNEQDFNYIDGESIPVLLGSEYMPYLKEGDSFEGYYLCEEFIFQVKGFIEKESFFISPETRQYESCSRYIIMPSFNFEKTTEFSKIHLLQQMVGVIYSDFTNEQISDMYKNILMKAGIPTWNIFVYEEDSKELSPVKLYKGMSNEIKRNFQLLLIMLLISFIVVITLILCAIFKKYHLYFGIKRLCGARKKKIFLEILLISATPIITGSVMAFFLAIPFVNLVLGQVVLLFISAFAVIVLVTVICSKYLFKFELRDVIGGKE